ncbi:LuxR family transcriptional regulator [Kitasatospora camelliae]|uniref:LuxR family transcriptional regulator n=1 Tax=Kitasatospora camelliae TaxID=3156397 RepID=A0AAU8JW17_9ACTN
MKESGRNDVGGPASEILSPEARELYLRIVAAGGRLESVPDADGPLRSELLDLGLLIPDSHDPDCSTVVDPAHIAGRLSSQWQEQALALLSRAVNVPTALQDLSQAYGSLGHLVESGGPVEYVHGVAEISQRLEILVEGAYKEVLTAQPGGSRPQHLIQRIGDRDVVLVRRGVSRRTIYQPSARYSPPTRQYAERMTELGAEIRTLAEPFTRLIIVDREVAVIPAQGDEKAAFIHDAAVVRYLTGTFEGLWDRAIPFPGATEVPQEVISRLRTRIVQMLIQGVGHRVIARSLGISERTLARHIADIREEYGAETLFQLGWRMAQQNPQLVDVDEDDPVLVDHPPAGPGCGEG